MPNNIQLDQCKICFNVWDRKGAMIHSNECNVKQINKVQCDHCANKFDPGGIKRHITVTHKDKIQENLEKNIRSNP